jgi:hypothetical protein
MKIVDKTSGGYVVYVSVNEMMNLTGLDLYDANNLKQSQEIDVKNLRNAVHMAETIQFNREKIVKQLKDMVDTIDKLPLHQFTNKGM